MELYWPSQKAAHLDVHVGRFSRHVLRALQACASTRFLPDRQAWKPKADGAACYYYAARYAASEQITWQSRLSPSLL